MINLRQRGSILISVCYAALIASIIGIVVASATLITIQGVKLSRIQLEATIHGNNIIETIKARGADNYLSQNLIFEGFTTNNGENVQVDVIISQKNQFYVIEVIMEYQWGQSTKETVVKGYQYAGG